jgi:hypothetical protein
MNRVNPKSFNEALMLLPLEEGVVFGGVFVTTEEFRNMMFESEIRSGHYYYIDYPEQLDYQAVLKWGAFQFYGYGDIPTNALVNALFEWSMAVEKVLKDGDGAVG